MPDPGAGEVSHPHPLSVLIVDDERPARRKLRRLLDAAPGISAVYEAPSGRLALEVIDEAEPDVIFLDVRMPGIDGFQLLDRVGPRRGIEVVFVTAYDEHALRAFDVRAIDYLLKPFDEERFRQALERARDAVAARHAAELLRPGIAAGTPPAEATGAGEAVATRLLVDAPGGRKVMLPLERVRRIEAQRNDAVFHVADHTYRLRTTLAALETRLDPDRFLRISRSEIVNLDHVAEIEPLDHGDARVHLLDGDIRRLSRRYRERMRRFG